MLALHVSHFKFLPLVWPLIPCMHIMTKIITPQIMTSMTPKHNMRPMKLHMPRNILMTRIMVHPDVRRMPFMTQKFTVFTT